MAGEAITDGTRGLFKAELTRRYVDGGTRIETISFLATDLQAARDFANDASFSEPLLDLRFKSAEVKDVRPAEE